MPDALSDHDMRAVLRTSRVIALVGASTNPARPSYGVMGFLLSQGHSVHPVNPGLAGQSIHGCRVYASLRDVPEPINMVDIFRNSEAVPPVVDEALCLAPLPQVIWMQLGVRHDDAARKAQAAGLTVVMNRCPHIEYYRLGLA